VAAHADREVVASSDLLDARRVRVLAVAYNRALSGEVGHCCSRNVEAVQGATLLVHLMEPGDELSEFGIRRDGHQEPDTGRVRLGARRPRQHPPERGVGMFDRKLFGAGGG